MCKYGKWLIILSFVIILLLAIVLGMIHRTTRTGVYETTDVAEYKKIAGNEDNATPQAFVNSFFPEKIESSFTNVVYHYTALENASHAYECYLEFTIEDSELFSSFIDKTIQRENTTDFQYDNTFQEYSIRNQFDLSMTRQTSNGTYPIQYAVVGKILFSEQDQRVIFWALGVWDGGENTNQLNTFFSRFDIDAYDYYLNAYSTPKNEENSITNAEYDSQLQ